MSASRMNPLVDIEVSPYDAYKSRPLVVITPIKRRRTWAARLMLLIDTTSRLDMVHKLAFIHFARWQVILRGSLQPFDGDATRERLRHDYFMFSTNYNGSWDQYIDAFSFVPTVARGLNHLWMTSQGFPGPSPLAQFKDYIHYHEVDVDHYYDAYPEASVRDISAASDLYARIDEFCSRHQSNVNAQELEALISSIAQALGSIQAHASGPGVRFEKHVSSPDGTHLRRVSPRFLQKRPKRSRYNYLTALCPIKQTLDDGTDHGPWFILTERLRSIAPADSPFRDCPMVHMARLQIYHDPTPALGDQQGDQFHGKFLLFIAEFDGDLGDFLDRLYCVAPDLVHDIWSCCQQFPEDRDRVFFRRYIERCSLPVQLPYAAFDLTVEEIVHALAVQREMREWLIAWQDGEPRAKVDSFQELTKSLGRLSVR